MATNTAAPDTASRILDVAERLVQSRGFNAFSYADVAWELKVTKASLHYHYPGKAELGEALIDRYTGRFVDALAAIDARENDARAKLEAYTSIYADGPGRDHRGCVFAACSQRTTRRSPQPMRDGVHPLLR